MPSRQPGGAQFRDRARSQPKGTTTCVQVRADTDPDKKGGRRVVLVRACTLEVPRRRDSRLERKRPRRALSIPIRSMGICMQVQCDEPESFLQCDGFSCRAEVERTRPDVVSAYLLADGVTVVLTGLQISLSACQDGEQTWDAPSGTTFTQVRSGVNAIRCALTADDVRVQALIDLLSKSTNARRLIVKHTLTFIQTRSPAWPFAGSSRTLGMHIHI